MLVQVKFGGKKNSGSRAFWILGLWIKNHGPVGTRAIEIILDKIKERDGIWNVDGETELFFFINVKEHRIYLLVFFFFFPVPIL